MDRLMQVAANTFEKRTDDIFLYSVGRVRALETRLLDRDILRDLIEEFRNQALFLNEFHVGQRVRRQLDRLVEPVLAACKELGECGVVCASVLLLSAPPSKGFEVKGGRAAGTAWREAHKGGPHPRARRRVPPMFFECANEGHRAVGGIL